MDRRILLFLCCSALLAQPAKKLEEARLAEAGGQFESALQIYDSARKEAQAAGDKAVEADAALNCARVLEIWASIDPSQKARLPEALQAYGDASRVGTPAQKLSAGISRSSLLLHLERSAEAVQVFRQMDFSAADPSRRYYYETRFAQSLERNGDKQEAFSRYLNAVNQRPSYRPAVEGASRILLDSSPPRTADALSLGRLLLSSKQTDLAGPQIRLFLAQWAAEPDGQRLLALLLQYYVVASLSPPEFQKTEREFLAKVGGRAPSLRRAIEDIERAYSGSLAPQLDPNAVRQLFPAWATGGWQESIFSSTLKNIGDYYDREEQPAPALSSYFAAWAVDMTNTDAALYAATTLRDHTKELDPQGRVFDGLVDSFFSAKGVLYQKKDWPNILRMHLVLAEIFERDGKWGKESDTHSVIFQLNQAEMMEKRVREASPEFPPSPGLHQRLGNAYQQTGRNAEAWEQYVTAAEGFVQYSNADQAAAALGLAKALRFAPTTIGRDRVRDIEEQAQNLRKGPSAGVPASSKTTPATFATGAAARAVTPAARPTQKKLPLVSIDKELSPEGKYP